MFKLRGLVIVIISSVAMVCSAEPDENHFKIESDVSGVNALEINLPVGEVQVSGTSGDFVRAEVTISCHNDRVSGCDKNLLKNIQWSFSKDGDSRVIELMPSNASHYNNASVIIHISVPQNKSLAVNLGYGDLTISDTNACLDATLKAGDLKINLAENLLASVSLVAAVGDSSLNRGGEVTHGSRTNLVGAVLKWDSGNGKCHLFAKTLAGDVKAALH